MGLDGALPLSFCLLPRHEDGRESGDIAPSFLTSALDGDQLHVVVVLSPVKEPPVSVG
jgi:hypothetical protein